MISRRDLLKYGGGTLFVALGGFVWHGVRRDAFSVAQGDPWKLWTLWDDPQYQGTPTAIAIAGMLAANPHNTQPWVFEVDESAEQKIIRLYADQRRNLGAFDPYLREMHIGLGCAIENMLLAAPAHGWRAEVNLTGGRLNAIPQNPEQKLIATLTLTRAQPTRSALYQAIGQRHTNRGAYLRDRPIPGDIVNLFQTAARAVSISLSFFDEGRSRELFDKLTNQATETIIHDEDMVAASHHWFRGSPEEIERHRDGVTLDTAGLSPMILMAAKMLPALSSEDSHQAWADATRNVHLATAPLAGIIAVRTRWTVKNSLAAGQLWQRLHLMATERGIAMHPINQTVEIVDRERMLNKPARMDRQLRKLVKNRMQPTFAFRMGYAESQAPPSPRRKLGNIKGDHAVHPI